MSNFSKKQVCLPELEHNGLGQGKHKPHKFPSELRLDLVSRDWVVIATGRAKKPEMFRREKRKKESVSQKLCPFCNIETQEKPTLVFSRGKEIPFEGWDSIVKRWTTIVIPNKFPAFTPHPYLDQKTEGGLYQTMNAVGYHEVVVTRNHVKQIAQFSRQQAKELIDVYRARYVELKKEKFVNHISIFHNHGPGAGASLAHPHSQIITTPLIDVDLKKALVHSKVHYQRYKECIYCKMNRWEMRTRRRIIFDNKDFVVLCPFASKTAFEVIISPKRHSVYFEQISEEERWSLAECLQVALKKIYKALNDPDYNFYLHSAPCDGKNYDFYHWHWTILPKTAIWAGFEIGTRMEISTIEPEKAAVYLRKQ